LQTPSGIKTLRTGLQTPSGIKPRHPARYRLAQRLHGKPDVYMVYDRRMLLVDYRLAAVRYAVGMQPVDDFWYTRPQTLPETLPTFDRERGVIHEDEVKKVIRRYADMLLVPIHLNLPYFSESNSANQYFQMADAAGQCH
jgi:hypothetical protein